MWVEPLPIEVGEGLDVGQVTVPGAGTQVPPDGQILEVSQLLDGVIINDTRSSTTSCTTGRTSTTTTDPWKLQRPDAL